jgi:hypothetical protein
MPTSCKNCLSQIASFVPSTKVQYFDLDDDYTIGFCLVLLQDMGSLASENS